MIGKYHDLWHVEQSFRMSKTDLRARPMFHHTRDAIEAHLTVVFTALAIARYLQAETGTSLRSLVRTLRPALGNHHHHRRPPPHRSRPPRPGRGPHPHRTGSTDPVIGAGH